jgi:murein DD-endopeptidase MepM/ murein hydrolase activator NlpD
VRSQEINPKEIKEVKEESSVVIEELKDEPIAEEEMKKKLIEKNEENKEKLIIEKEQKEKSNVEEEFRKEVIVKENLMIESDGQNLKENTVINEESQKKTNISTNNSEEKKLATPCDSFNLKESCSGDSESDYEISYPKSMKNPLIKEMDQKSLRKFYARMKKQKPDQDLIDRVLKNKYSKINRIFDEPEKAIPLPRRNGTINITFSERAFPTPARESSHLEEQEVSYTFL